MRDIVILLCALMTMQGKYMTGKVSIESELFCQYLTYPATGVLPFLYSSTNQPVYGLNYYNFNDQPIENRVSPYNLVQNAQEPGKAFTCLDTARLLMFDEDDNLKVDSIAAGKTFYGFIIETGESLDYVKVKDPINILFYDVNHLVYLLFKFHAGTTDPLIFPLPFPFKVQDRATWNILDPTLTSIEIPQQKTLNDPEALLANVIYNYEKNDRTRGDFFMNRFKAVTGFSETFVSSSQPFRNTYEPKFSRLGVNVETRIYALLTMYYSIRVYEQNLYSNDEFVRYLSVKSMLWRIQQKSSITLNTKNTATDLSKAGGFLKYIEIDKYKNPIELKASLLCLFSIGYNSYITYEPYKFPMRFLGSQDSSNFGNSTLYTGGNRGYVLSGPFVTLPIGNYQVVFFFTSDYDSGSGDAFDHIYFDTNINGASNACATFNTKFNTGYNWYRVLCSFSLSKETPNIEFRVRSESSLGKYFSTIKLRKN